MSDSNLEIHLDAPVILAVDDQRTNLLILETILARPGYVVESVMTGGQALKRAGELRPDLILLDIMLPDTDGFSVCEQLKAQPETREIPVIFLTARTQTESVVVGFEKGGADYVTKPFKEAELLARVRSHIDLKRAMDAQAQLIARLERALSDVKTLRGLIPICACCKKVRDDTGYWHQVESYVSAQSEARFSHGLCPNCAKEMLPEYDPELVERQRK